MIENNPEVKYEKYLYRFAVMDEESRKVAGMYKTLTEKWILPEDIEVEKERFLRNIAELEKIDPKIVRYDKYCVGWNENEFTYIMYIMGFLKV
jgi:hypothetical protein